ncbi:MAG: murein biosynthesis integral membrane protein MurJ [Alkalispirochaeta sp.]
MSDRRRTHIVSTAIVMASTFLSRILGFVRIAVIGAVFGASGNADVLNLVFNIPNNLRKLLAEGALSSAFVPVLSRAHVEDSSGQRSRNIVRSLLGLQLLILVPLLTVAAIFPQPIVDVILDFPERSRQLLAGDLFRYLIHYVLLISVAAVFMGTLNSMQRFLIPALSPLWFSVAVIGSIFALHRHIGVYSMVVGVGIGGIGQVLIHVPAMLNAGYSLRPRFHFADPYFRSILKRWLPVVSTASVFAINQQIALFFASGLEDGSGSAMTNALVFWQLPFGIFSASITTVLFPAMSRHFAEEDVLGLRETVLSGLRGLVLLLVPAGIGLIVLGKPMIAVALQRGAFTPEATRLAAEVLAWYSVGLFSVGAFTFLQRFFYACDDYRTPLRIAAITVALDVGLSLWLKETRLRVAGLSLANSAAFTIGLVLMLRSARSAAGTIPLRTLVPSALRAAIASTAALVAVGIVRFVMSRFGLEDWPGAGSSLRTFGLFLLEAIPAAAALIGGYHLMGINVRRILRGH